MSEFKVEVVRVPALEKHPNADTLSVATVFGSPVIVRTGEIKEDDFAYYVPYDSMVPVANPAFAFLDPSGKAAAKGKSHVRVRPVRLRGLYSEGLLLPVQHPSWIPGDDVAALLDVYKYEEPEAPVHGLVTNKSPKAHDPGVIPRYDLESFLKYGEMFEPQEPVVVTEKIHGCNFRAVYHNGKLHVGSHNTFRSPPRTGKKWLAVLKGLVNVVRCWFTHEMYWAYLNGYENEIKPVEADTWWTIAQRYDLENKLKAHPDVAIYGEVYGSVQDLQYSVPPEEGTRLAVFDVFDVKAGWLDFSRALIFVRELKLPYVPVLSVGCLCDDVLALRAGKSAIDNKTMREGIVIRPLHERRDKMGRRVVLKLVSEEYKLRPGGTERH